MKPVLLLLLLLGSINAYSQSQSELNNQAKKEFRQSEKELNEIYQLVLKEYAGNKPFVQRMKEAQKLWLQFRDAQTRAMFPNEPRSYGSAYPSCEAHYLKDLNEQRAATLRAWLNVTKPEQCQGSIGDKEDH